MLIHKLPGENRTFEQLKQHYEIEKKLAQRLLNSDREKRQHLYAELYDQLFQQVPHHPQITHKADPEAATKKVAQKMRLIDKYLQPESVFLELGPGDCNLAFTVAQQAKKVYAVDVSQEITKHVIPPDNFELIISDGCHIPVPENTVDVAYSNHLMEHLHPDDAFDQIRHIYRALKPGGVYICITPNRLAGPHDISMYFDRVATGFHLKEYTHTELSNLFARIGFSQTIAYIGGQGVYLDFPILLIKIFERILDILPFFARQKIANLLPIKALLGVIIVAQK